MLADAYKRWRHTRGYGVHSPFAFRIVNEVIREPRGYRYYGYDETDAAGTSGSRRMRRMARMLLRLAACLDVRSAFVAGSEVSAVYSAALRCARSGMIISGSPADIDRCRLICAPGDAMPPASLFSLISTPGRIMLLSDVDDSLAAALFEALQQGVMFRSGSDVMIIARDGMQKISYTVFF